MVLLSYEILMGIWYESVPGKMGIATSVWQVAQMYSWREELWYESVFQSSLNYERLGWSTNRTPNFTLDVCS
jgi:hypothetical protein